ncbi:MAG: hypothetical protein WBX22_32770 [Silvibacterium sp.]
MTSDRIAFGNSSARGKGAAECGNALDVASELDLFCEERAAGVAVFGALISEVRFILSGKFCCQDEGDVVGYLFLLDETVPASILITQMPGGHGSPGKEVSQKFELK